MRANAPTAIETDYIPQDERLIAPIDLPIEEAVDQPVRHDRAVRILTIAAVATFVWLAVIAACIYLLARFQPAPDLTLSGLAALAAGVSAPLTAIWLAALVVARVNPGESRASIARLEAAEQRFEAAATATRQQLEAIDGIVAVVATRVEGLRATLSMEAGTLAEISDRVESRSQLARAQLETDCAALDAVAGRLSMATDKAHNGMAELLETLPQAEKQAAAVAMTLQTGATDARTQIDAIEAALDAVWSRNEDAQRQAEAAAQALTTALNAIDSAASNGATALEARTGALTEAANLALNRAGEALEATRTGVEAQAAAIVGSIEQARTLLDGAGADASRAIAKRLEKLSHQAEVMAQRLAEQDERSRALSDTLERGLHILDAKLGNAAQAADGTISRLSERLIALREQVHDIGLPLSVTRDATQDIENAVTALRASIETTLATLETSGPERTAALQAQLAALSQEYATLDERMNQLAQSATGLTAPVAAHQAAIEETGAALAAQIAQASEASAQIVAQLEAARAVVTAIEADTSGAALGATSRLVEAMGRVRDVAHQAAGTMRTTLEGVVAEAREALSEAGNSAIGSTFTEQVTAQIKAVEEAAEQSVQAAQRAADRLSRQLVLITETAANVETRITDADTRLDQSAREDLTRQSNLLIEAMNSASIDVTKVLSADIADQAWTAYLKGDRGIFTRRAVSLLSGSDARTVVRHYEQEPEFRDSVRRYIHDFEAMMRRILRDRDGSALSIALLSSDVGKLYVALAQATDRLRT